MDLMFRKADIEKSARALCAPIVVKNRMEALIKEKNESIKHLESVSGVPRRTIYNVLSGEDTRISTIYKLCKAEGVTLSEFFEGFEDEVEAMRSDI